MWCNSKGSHWQLGVRDSSPAVLHPKNPRSEGAQSSPVEGTATRSTSQTPRATRGASSELPAHTNPAADPPPRSSPRHHRATRLPSRWDPRTVARRTGPGWREPSNPDSQAPLCTTLPAARHRGDCRGWHTWRTACCGPERRLSPGLHLMRLGQCKANLPQSN